MERRVFFLCLLSFLMFAEAVSWFTAGGLGPCLIEPEHSQQAANDDEKKDCPTFFAGSLLLSQRGFEWIKRDDNDKAVVAAFTIVLGISTIGLWLATNKLWGAGERQLKHLGETAAMELRAYISVESGASFKQRRRFQFEFRPILRNNGNTPASNVRVVSMIDVVPPNIPANFTYPIGPIVGGQSVTTIGPRQERFHSRILGRQAAFAELREIYTGDKCFHLWGKATYQDVFGVDHYTNFSFVIFIGRRREAPVWHNTETNNDAT
jgi:hypothetical protein